MQRKPALAAAAVTAILGATGFVAVSALIGGHVFGLRFGAARPQLASASPTSADTTEVTEPPTEPPTTVVPTVPTTKPDPVFVIQTEYYDQFVVVPTNGTDTVEPEAPAADPTPNQQPATPPAAAPAAAPAGQPAPAPAAQPALAPAPEPPVDVTEAPTAAPTTRPTVPPVTLPKSGLTCGDGCKINVPAEAKGFDLPAFRDPPTGLKWKQCEFHMTSPATTATNHLLPGYWECQT